MWFFRVPEFYFGDDALEQLAELNGRRAFIVTDPNINALGYVNLTQKQLQAAGIECQVFDEVEPDPSIQTVRRGAAAMADYEPDWIIGLGGGSSMDAAKAMWILYEHPDIDPAEINPFDELILRQKARLICIPTTAGTGSESGYGIILTDTEQQRKLTLGARSATPDIAIIDPVFTANLPAQITADTGVDALTHAVEGYTCAWANDFTDGLCLHAARMIVNHLPRAVANGANDGEAREKMANAAAIAGMALGNSQVALAHAMGHSFGAIFKQIPHGRITGLFLPYTIEFVANGDEDADGRYGDLADAIGAPAAEGDANNGRRLASAIRDWYRKLGQPVNLEEAVVDPEAFKEALELVVEHIDVDPGALMSPRIPETEEIQRLLEYAYEGKTVDF